MKQYIKNKKTNQLLSDLFIHNSIYIEYSDESNREPMDFSIFEKEDNDWCMEKLNTYYPNTFELITIK